MDSVKRTDLGVPKNGSLRLYNMFPRMYDSMGSMTEQLQLIANKGCFNAVWINPIQQTDPTEYTRSNMQVGNSLYSPICQVDPYEINFASFLRYTEDDLKQFTKKAKELRLNPIFDLVMNQVGAHSPILEKH